MKKPVHLALLLIAAAIGIQAATDESYHGSKIDDPSHDGGGDMRTTSNSSMIAVNRAGNHEEE